LRLLTAGSIALHHEDVMVRRPDRSLERAHRHRLKCHSAPRAERRALAAWIVGPDEAVSWEQNCHRDDPGDRQEARAERELRDGSTPRHRSA